MFTNIKDLDKVSNIKKFDVIRNSYKEKILEIDGCVYCDMLRKYNVDNTCFPYALEDVLSCTIDAAEGFINKRYTGIPYGLSDWSVNEVMTKINQGLGEAGENSEKYLPKVWKGSIEEEMLDATFWALTFMDEKLRHRARVAHYLDSCKVELGLSGYSEKLGKFLSCYFTIFDDYVFYINPIKGKVYRSNDRVYGGYELEVKDHKLYKGKTLIAEEDIGGVLTFYIEKDEKAKDNKKSEKEKKRAAGKKVKDTCWLMTNLGHMFGHNCNIKTHTFIALMVYGFDTCKFAVQESNSILSLDHTIPQHNLNEISNLGLCSRSKNNSKKAKIENIFDYFLYFMGMEQVEVQAEEVSEEKDTKNDIPEWLKEPTKEEWDAFIAYHNRPITAEEACRKYGFIMVKEPAMV